MRTLRPLDYKPTDHLAKRRGMNPRWLGVTFPERRVGGQNNRVRSFLLLICRRTEGTAGEYL